MWETQIQSPRWEDPLMKEMTTHSRTLAWKFHGLWSLVSYSPWNRKELHSTEQLHFIKKQRNKDSQTNFEKEILKAHYLISSLKLKLQWFCIVIVKGEICRSLKLNREHINKPIQNIDGYIQFILKKMQRQINGERTVFSNNGASTFELSYT